MHHTSFKISHSSADLAYDPALTLRPRQRCPLTIPQAALPTRSEYLPHAWRVLYMTGSQSWWGERPDSKPTLTLHRYRRTPSRLIVFDSEASLGSSPWYPISTNGSLGCLITSKAWSLAQREVKESTQDFFQSIYEPLKGFLEKYFIYLSHELPHRVTAWTGRLVRNFSTNCQLGT